MERLYATGHIYRVPVEELINPGEYINKYMTSEDKLIELEKKGYVRLITEGADKYKYYDVYAPKIVYGKIYTNDNELCKGEKYTVLSAFRKRASQDSGYNKSLTVVVLMLDSATILKVPYYKLYTNDIYDPYYTRSFNNHCCIGNVKTANLTEKENTIYILWKEIMGRLYNQENFIHKLCDEYDIQPAIPNWKCFEYFYNYYLHYETYFDHVVEPNPNDPVWYYTNFKITRESSRALWKCPYDLVLATTGHKLPERIRKLNIQERIMLCEQYNLSEQQLQEIQQTKDSIVRDSNELISEYRKYKPMVDELKEIYDVKIHDIGDYYALYNHKYTHYKANNSSTDNNGNVIMYDVVDDNKYRASELLANDQLLYQFIQQYDALEPYIKEYNTKAESIIHRIAEFNKQYPRMAIKNISIRKL